MKGQSEVIVFVLLFLIGVTLFLSSVIWSQGIFNRNSDMAKLNNVENFMVNLDNKIQNIVKLGGQDSIDYGIQATIQLTSPNTIEIQSPLTVKIPADWVVIPSKYSNITEKLDGNLLRLRLQYPTDSYAIYLYTDGPTLATPQKVYIEKVSTYTQNNIEYIKVKITFK